MSKLKMLFKYKSKSTKLFNVYGPTECTCICSSHIVSKQDFMRYDKIPPIGSINKDYEWFLGEIKENKIIKKKEGELYLSGPSVGIGYINNIELTKTKFIEIQLSNGLKKTFYNTGDLMKIDTNGNLVFLGRKDFQVKYKGYRIELEEIEFNLGKLSETKEVSVIKAEYKGIERLVCFISLKVHVEKDLIYNKLEKLLLNT